MSFAKFLTQRRFPARTRPVAERPPAPVYSHPIIDALGLDERPAKMTMDDIYTVAQSISVPRANMLALFRQESGSQAFHQHSDGKWYPTARLELHKLSEYTDHMFADERPDLFKRKFNIKDSSAPQEEQYRRMREAIPIIEGYFGHGPVLAATGWGLTQIQGSNYKFAGSGTVDRFVQRMATSEAEQLQALAAFLDNTGISKFLAKGDWLTFAKHYNGSARAAGYAKEIAQHYAVVSGRTFV